MPSLEIHIPISPTPSFYTMVHYLAASIRRNGGAFADARFVVSVGEDVAPFDVAAHAAALAAYDVTWHWTDRDDFRRRRYSATGHNRFAQPFTSDYVLMADADVLVARDFADILERLPADGIAGVIETVPPFLGRDYPLVDGAWWGELYRRAGLAPPAFAHRHPGVGVYYAPDAAMANAPPYYNYGFVFGSRSAMTRIAATIEDDARIAAAYVRSELRDQVALTLSIVRNGIATAALPVRYNFWTDDPYLAAFPDDARDARVIHYRTGPAFVKTRDAASPLAVADWLDANAGAGGGITGLLRTALAPVHARVVADAG